MKAKVVRNRAGPIEVKCGNVTVKIYTGTNRVGDKAYPQFTLVYYHGHQRKKIRFADLRKAKREAELVATKLANGENEVLRLTSLDRSVYVQALEHLRPLGAPLNLAVLEYVSAVKNLPEGSTLKEAVEFFKIRNRVSLEQRTVQQVVEEMLATKRAAKLSEDHLRDLKCRLGRFSGTFQMNIASVSSSMIQAWLDGMEVSGRTKKNYLRVIGSLFRFGIARRYLARDAIEEVDSVQQAKADNNEIEIFTPAEFADILNSAQPELVPCLAIGGLAGLRSAELQRLDWREVNLAERHIEIKASNAKTAARRLAPVTDSLAAWLAPHSKPTGKIIGFELWWRQIPKLVQEIDRVRNARGNTVKFVWKHNGLRHSFCSYRLASIKNAAQVALEAGNSPQIVFHHYRQLVTESEARRWFSIHPQAAQSVVNFTQASAA